jgi:hypothetical protein
MSRFEADVAAEHPEIAVIAIPGEEAQAVLDRIVRTGIKAVLNFAPVQLHAPADRGSFRAMVVGLFGLRRKQMLRALRELTGWPAERCAPLLEAAGIAGAARAETLPPATFARLFRILVDGGWGGG